MKKKTQSIAALITASVLVMAIAVPAAALQGAAKPEVRSTSTTSAAAGQAADTRAANLRNRIENVLRARKARFDAIAANLQKRQARVEVLAGKVEALGGDVAQVRTMIQESTRLLEQARVQEQVCVSAFKAVPEAENKGVAFRAARAEGRKAVELMKQSRIQLRTATQELARIAEGVAATEE